MTVTTRRTGQSLFWPSKMSHSFIQNCCWITLQVSHHQGWKTCVRNGSKITGTFSMCAYRLTGTGIVECLEIIVVGCNSNSLMAWPDWSWPPYVTRDLPRCVETSVVITPRALVFSIAVTQDNLPFGLFIMNVYIYVDRCHAFVGLGFFLGFPVAVSGWTYRSGRRCWV